MVLPKVALACNLARSDSNSDFAFCRWVVQRSIQGLSQVRCVKDSTLWPFVRDQAMFEVKLQITVVSDNLFH